MRELVRAAPDIYPGFYTLPTPAKESKRKLLQRSLRIINHTIGMTFTDECTSRLLEEEDAATERMLYARQSHPPSQVGIELAIGFFRRVRRRETFSPARHLLRERVVPAWCGSARVPPIGMLE